MALDPSVLLDAVEAEILARLADGAYDEYSKGDERFKGFSLKDLREFRNELLQEVGTSGTAMFSRLVPFVEGGSNGTC